MKLILLGAGGFGRTVADVVEQMDRYDEILFLDDQNTAADVVGKLEDFREFPRENTEFYPAFGNNAFRISWLNRLEDAECKLATIVHPTVYCSPKSTIAPGTAVLPRAMINTDCEIRRGCILNMGAMIDHGCILEEGAHISIGAIIRAENRIPAGMKIEAGQVIPDRLYPL